MKLNTKTKKINIDEKKNKMLVMYCSTITRYAVIAHFDDSGELKYF